MNAQVGGEDVLNWDEFARWELCQWVFTEKVRNGKKVVKTRPIASGFLEKVHNDTTGL